MKINNREFINIDEKTDFLLTEILLNGEIILFANGNDLWTLKQELVFINFFINRHFQ